MYKKSKFILGESRESLSNYVEGFDVYNSLLLSTLLDPNIPRETYEITVYEYRPDLIARDFYGSENYMGILMVQTALNLDGYTKGTILNLVSKSNIDAILDNL